MTMEMYVQDHDICHEPIHKQWKCNMFLKLQRFLNNFSLIL